MARWEVCLLPSKEPQLHPPASMISWIFLPEPRGQERQEGNVLLSQDLLVGARRSPLRLAHMEDNCLYGCNGRSCRYSGRYHDPLRGWDRKFRNCQSSPSLGGPQRAPSLLLLWAQSTCTWPSMVAVSTSSPSLSIHSLLSPGLLLQTS